MKFIITNKLCHINTAHIVSTYRATDPGVYIVEMVGGGTHEVSSRYINQLGDELKANATFIPALPGYRVVYPQDDGTAWLDDIIAWRIVYGGAVLHPVTINGADNDNHPILFPDGSVAIPHLGDWDTLDAYLAEMAATLKTVGEAW